jgi:phosphohistidine phosphatase SixA
MGNAWPEAYRADERNFLTPQGVLQSQLVGGWFARMGYKFDHLYSSNLTRARHTMAVILHETGWKRPWINLPSLNEMSDPDNPEEEARVRGAFHNIINTWTDGDMLIVSHYHCMQVMFEYLPVERKNIESYGGRRVGNGVPFMWDPDPEHEWRITCPDMTQIGEQT